MRAKLSVLVVSVISLATLGAADRGHTSLRPFLGLWEGVDVNDGSRRTISITDRDGDGQAEVDSHDSYWTLCTGDRGLERATGGVRDGVLETTGLVTCFESGVQVPVTQTYELSKRDGTLLATPLGTSLTAIILHRVSE